MGDADTAYKAAEEEIERVRAEGTTILSFDAAPFRALDRLPPEIAALTELWTVDLADTQVTDLTPLQGLSALRWLHLDTTPVTDLSPLHGLTALWELFLNDTQVADLTPLQGLLSLQELYLAKTQVTDLTPLPGLSALRKLSLDSTPVTDLTFLQGLSALETLRLHTTQIKELAPLKGLNALSVLDLDTTPVTDLSPLQSLSALETLSLANTQVTDLRPIAELAELGKDTFGGLSFKGTPAARATPELTRLSQIADNRERTRETLAYLRTLPPFPAPLPWEDTGVGAGGETPAAQAAQAQIAFLLDHAATSQAGAATTASQIRHALRDVPATDGNKLPPVLQTMLDVAQVLDRLSRAPIGPENPDREAELTARIAELEAEVQALTVQLHDADAAREAAETLARAQGFLPNLTRAAGTSIGEQAGRLLHTGILSGTVYFLGTNHALHHALLRALEALK